MRMKLALLAMTALLLDTASASAITVKKRTEAPGLPPQIWEVVGDFCAIKKWQPAVADCIETKEDDATIRTLMLKDGGKLRDKLTGAEGAGYTYENLESSLPVKNYKSKLWLEVDDEPNRSIIYWQADFDASGASDEEAKAKVTRFLADGVKGIKQQALAAHDAKEAKGQSGGSTSPGGGADTDNDND